MKNLLLLSCFIFGTLLSQEKPVKCWIYFTSKPQPTFAKNSSLHEYGRSIGISSRALTRRAKVSPAIISPEDFPISENFIAQVKQHGIVIENQLPWFNAVTAYLTAKQQQQIASLPFVKSIMPVRTFTQKELPSMHETLEKNVTSSAAAVFDYGPSLTQMQLIDAVAVHNIGITGRGVLVGMLDSGFRWRIHEALKNLNVIAEYDFIQKDSITANQAGDYGGQDSHGTSTLSLVGGFKEGQVVSPAFNASFILGKTEYVPTETNVEEDNWAAAIEWMEQNGVDVVSSSLGYSEFDPTDANGIPQHNYTYADMNGRTATTTKAAVIAARKGVVVVNAMGNEALAPWHYLTAPADADSIVSVGAVTSTGAYASFSSVGPTSDGRIKPDVVAHGVHTYCAAPGVSTYNGSSHGTSFATPLTAGVAAMILSAHPELTPIQVRDALRNTASNSSSPNNIIGWGIIDAYKAVLYNGVVISTDPEIIITPDSNFSISVDVVSQAAISKDSVMLYYSNDTGKTFVPMVMKETISLDSLSASGKYTAVVPHGSSGTDVLFYIQAKDNSPRTTKTPYNAPIVLYDAKTGSVTDRRPKPPTTYVLEQNFPNPFNPATVIRYQLPRAEFVSLKIYNILGKEVTTLVSDVQSAGSYDVPFTASRLASGIYFYRIQTPTFTQTKKMVLLK